MAASDRHAEFRRALSQDFRVLTTDHPLNIEAFNAALEQARGRNDWLSSVLLEYVRAHAPRIGSTVRRIISQDRLREFGPWTLDNSSAWLPWYAAYSVGMIRGRASVSVRLLPSEASFRFLYAESCISGEGRAALVPPSGSPSDSSWQFIQTAGKFCADPSADTLATAMHSYLDLRAEKNLPGTALTNYPWPLAECIRAVRKCNGDKILSLLDTGGFGSLEDWLALEQKWGEGVFIDELLDLPPLLNSVDSRNELYSFPFRVNMDPRRAINIGQTFYGPMVDAFDQASSAVVKSFFGGLLLSQPLGADARPDVADTSWADTSWIDRVLMEDIAYRGFINSRFFDLMRYIDIENPKWSPLLGSVFPGTFMRRYPFGATQALSRLREIIDLGVSFEGFLVPFATAMGGPGFETRRRLVRPATISNDASLPVRFAAVLIDIVAGIGVSELSQRIRDTVQGKPYLLRQVLDAIALRDLPYENECEEILKCINIMPQDPSNFLHALQQNFLRRRSRLFDYRVWSDLALPGDMLRILDLGTAAQLESKGSFDP